MPRPSWSTPALITITPYNWRTMVARGGRKTRLMTFGSTRSAEALSTGMPDGERTRIVATDRPAMGTSPGLPGVASLTSDRLKAVSPTAATTARQR